MASKEHGNPDYLPVVFVSEPEEVALHPRSADWVVVRRILGSQEQMLHTYANLLGQPHLIGRKPAVSIQNVIGQLECGLPKEAVTRLGALLGVGPRAMRGALTVRSFARGNTLAPDVSERLLRLGALFQQTLQVLGDVQVARRWFSSPKKALGGKTPLEFARTEIGAREVEDLLGRVEHGVYS